MNEPSPMQPAHDTTRSRRDLALVLLLTALAAVLAVRFDVNESLMAWAQRRERFQLDELPGVLLTLAACLAWFAWRRYREAAAALAAQRDTDARLASALADNQRLLRQYANVQESERKSLARELHDELGQTLNAIKIDAVTMRNAAHESQPQTEAACRAIIGNVDQVQAVVGDMIRRLRPVGLDDLGLAAALEHCVQSWRARSPGTRFTLAAPESLDALAEAQSITLYRMVQEALTNVAKHAQATSVSIVLQCSGDNREGGIVVEVDDDGVGADLTVTTSGLGLAGMRERIEALGGTLRIASAPGRGLRLHARLPVQPPQ